MMYKACLRFQCFGEYQVETDEEQCVVYMFDKPQYLPAADHPSPTLQSCRDKEVIQTLRVAGLPLGAINEAEHEYPIPCRLDSDLSGRTLRHLCRHDHRNYAEPLVLAGVDKGVIRAPLDDRVMGPQRPRLAAVEGHLALALQDDGEVDGRGLVHGRSQARRQEDVPQDDPVRRGVSGRQHLAPGLAGLVECCQVSVLVHDGGEGMG